jgi:CheY-like chemotaxis protein
LKVLLIDDNQEITEAVSFYLESQSIECKVLNEGRKGLESIKNNNENFDVILLDLAMPEFSGYDIFNVLKEEGLLKLNNVILFTASNLADDKKQKMLSDGAKGVLIKPVSIDELADAIKRFQ